VSSLGANDRRARGLTLRVKYLLQVRAGDGKDEVEICAAKVRMLDRVVGSGDGQLEEMEHAVEDGKEERVEDLEERRLVGRWVPVGDGEVRRWRWREGSAKEWNMTRGRTRETHFVLGDEESDETQQFRELREGNLTDKTVDKRRDERQNGLSRRRNNPIEREASLRHPTRSSASSTIIRRGRAKRKKDRRRTASRMTTNAPIVFATAKIPSVASLNTATQAPLATGLLADKSGNPFATSPAAMMR
jgi:hypothetical protein